MLTALWPTVPIVLQASICGGHPAVLSHDRSLLIRSSDKEKDAREREVLLLTRQNTNLVKKLKLLEDDLVRRQVYRLHMCMLCTPLHSLSLSLWHGQADKKRFIESQAQRIATYEEGVGDVEKKNGALM